MGTLVYVCPITGHQVSTGVEVDRSSFKSLPRTKTAIFCPRCHKNHLLSRIWAHCVCAAAIVQGVLQQTTAVSTMVGRIYPQHS